jgi:hypothetical protein
MTLKGTVVRVTPATRVSYSYKDKFNLSLGSHKEQTKHEHPVIEFIVAVQEETGEELIQVESEYEPARASIKEGDPVTIAYYRCIRASHGEVTLDLVAMAEKRRAAAQPEK